MKKILFVVIVAQMGMLLAAPTVTDVVAKQRYPWNGLVDITCKVTGKENTAPYTFCLSAIMPDSGSTNRLSRFLVMQNGVQQIAFSVKTNGNYHLIWDARGDLGKVQYADMVVNITIEVKKVQLWANGPYWATTNIGAGEPWESGYYFWWGDTIGYIFEDNQLIASDGSNSNFEFGDANTPTYGLESLK